jgi:hypothetical protein
MSAGLAFYVITTTYPDYTAEMLQQPAIELTAAWDVNPIWNTIYLTEDMPLLQKVWGVKPTMVHPTHVAALGEEIARVLERATDLPDGAIGEMRGAQALCERTAAAGQWLVTIGP